MQATRGRRAADRTVASWAHDHAAALRQLAGTITALPDLPATAMEALAALHAAQKATRAASVGDRTDAPGRDFAHGEAASCPHRHLRGRPSGRGPGRAPRRDSACSLLRADRAGRGAVAQSSLCFLRRGKVST